MTWQEVVEHPSLQNLPFKIELDAYGRILMSPVKIYHSAFQGEIIRLLQALLAHGRTLPECAIATRLGTKVADVAWISDARFEEIKFATESPIAPEICIEIMSSSNTNDEMEEKRQLYFEQGAHEVWICSEDGELRFDNANGQLKASQMVPGFPHQVQL